jgi:hypothetical protein
MALALVLDHVEGIEGQIATADAAELSVFAAPITSFQSARHVVRVILGLLAMRHARYPPLAVPFTDGLWQYTIAARDHRSGN